MKLTQLICLTCLTTASVHAAEQDLLLRNDFVLKAGASQTLWLNVQPPQGTELLVLVGFVPVQALSVSCELTLYDHQARLLGSYNCSARHSYSLTPPLTNAAGFRARLEVTNSNFSQHSSAFSVLSRFKFISSE